MEVVPQKPGLNNTDFDINRNHSNYILVDKSYADTGFLRVDLEKQIQKELGNREANEKENASGKSHVRL